MTVRESLPAESEIPGWAPYREWFRSRWKQGGAAAWLLLFAHLSVGTLLFLVLSALPTGGGLLSLIQAVLLAIVGYATVMPPGEPYAAWTAAQWETNDQRKLYIVIGNAVAAFFVLGVVIGLPFNGFIGGVQSLLYLAAAYSLITLALNLHWGYAGIFNIGVAGFMAVGVYAMAIVSSPVDPGASGAPGLGLPLVVGIVVGTLVATLVGLVAALPALRLRADYFAIVTVAFSEIIRYFLLSGEFETFSLPLLGTVGTGGAIGKSPPPTPIRLLFYESHGAGADPALLGSVLFPLFDSLRLTIIPDGYAMNLGIATVPIGFTLDLTVEPSVIAGFFEVAVLVIAAGGFYWLLRRVGNSPFGRVLKAIREDETVAKSLGKDTNAFKLVSFALGCGLMGLGGILWFGQQGYIVPNNFKPIITFYVWVALMIGGAGSNTGSVLGGSLFVATLWEGPRYLKNAAESAVSFPSAPNNIIEALLPVFAGQLAPLLSFFVSNISSIRLVFIGALLVWLMQRRPEGLLGHRTEEAAAIPLVRSNGGESDE
ncbi:MAG: branched-chain amino acid ABC transporter permease [Halolamina sp.]